MTPKLPPLVAGLAVLVVTLPAAAGPIPWSYASPQNESIFPTGATGGFTFPNLGYTPATGDADLLATRLYAWSVAPADAPDRVTGLEYSFAVGLRDDLSGEAADLSFSGVLSGTYWLTGSDLANRFVGPTSQSVVLGGHTYNLTLTGFDAPDGYGEQLGGSIAARVTLGGLDPADPDPVPPSPTGPDDPVGTPEPATALLALLGLPALAATRWARRR